MEDIIVIGYGGHAKSIIDSIERTGKYTVIGYTDKVSSDSKYTYLGTDEVLKEYYDQGIRNAVIGIGYLGKNNIREKIYTELKKIGYNLPVIIDPSAIVSDDVIIGEGTFVGKKAILNANVNVGKMCIINTAAIVEHECKIEDFVHVSVGTILCGQVYVERAAFIGANATIIQCKKIIEEQIVPAGAVVRN